MIRLLFFLGILSFNTVVAQPGIRDAVGIEILDNGISILVGCCPKTVDSTICEKAPILNDTITFFSDTLFIQDCWSLDTNDYYMIFPPPFCNDSSCLYAYHNSSGECTSSFQITIFKSSTNEWMIIETSGCYDIKVEFQSGSYCFGDNGLKKRKEE